MKVDLARHAMLVSITIKLEGLLGERRDRGASELVETTYSVAHKRAKASKYLIDRRNAKVKAVIAAAQQVRAVAYRYTFPWGDSNLRLLPVTVHTQFKNDLEVSLSGLNHAIDEYVKIYPQLVKDSETELNGLFDSGEYPHVSKVRSMFKISSGYWPVPDSGHFVADIANEAADEARQSIIHDNSQRTADAINHLIARVEQTVKHFVDKLGAYRTEIDKFGKEKIFGIFRDSLVENVRDMSVLVRKLNFTNDASIEQLGKHLDRLTVSSADFLRENAETRQNMVLEGQALLAKLDAFRKTDIEVDAMIDSVSDYM